jgi:hypothetical protein
MRIPIKDQKCSCGRDLEYKGVIIEGDNVTKYSFECDECDRVYEVTFRVMTKEEYFKTWAIIE